MSSSGVEFEEGGEISTTPASYYSSRQILGTPTEPGLSRMLMKIGVSKNAKQSYYLLIIIALISFVITVGVVGYFIFGIGNPTETKTVFPKDLQKRLNSIPKTNE